jgi:hypothetical protein
MDPTPAPQLPWARLLPVRPALALPLEARSVFLWGDHRVHAMTLHTAAHVLAHGLHMAIIDADMAFQLRPLVAVAKACRVSPEVFLRRAHLVRAFTCWQFTTLFCERLASVLATYPTPIALMRDQLCRVGPLSHHHEGPVVHVHKIPSPRQQARNGRSPIMGEHDDVRGRLVHIAGELGDIAPRHLEPEPAAGPRHVFPCIGNSHLRMVLPEESYAVCMGKQTPGRAMALDHRRCAGHRRVDVVQLRARMGDGERH